MFAARIPVQVYGTEFGGADVYSMFFLRRVFPRTRKGKVANECMRTTLLVGHGHGTKHPVDTCSVKLKDCAQTETSEAICICDGGPNFLIALARSFNIRRKKAAHERECLVC